jgi:uncharacterized protein YhfF
MIAEENTNLAVKDFWQKFLESLPEEQRAKLKIPEAWAFGDSGAMADELGNLAFESIKAGTASLVEEYKAGQETLPRAGGLSILLDGRGKPICLIETTSVEIKPFNEVDARFAYDEGEGDRSMEYWRRVHRRFFNRTCAEIGVQFSEEMLVVCERFKVIYRP